MCSRHRAAKSGSCVAHSLAAGSGLRVSSAQVYQSLADRSLRWFIGSNDVYEAVQAPVLLIHLHCMSGFVQPPNHGHVFWRDAGTVALGSTALWL